MSTSNQYNQADPRELFREILFGRAANDVVNNELERIKNYNYQLTKGYIIDLINFDNNVTILPNKKGLETFDPFGNVNENLHHYVLTPSYWDDIQNKEIHGEPQKIISHVIFDGYSMYIKFCRTVSEQLNTKHKEAVLAKEKSNLTNNIDPERFEKFIEYELKLQQLGFLDNSLKWIEGPGQLAAYVSLLLSNGILKKTILGKTERAVRSCHRLFFENRYKTRFNKQFQKCNIERYVSSHKNKFTFLDKGVSYSISDLMP